MHRARLPPPSRLETPRPCLAVGPSGIRLREGGGFSTAAKMLTGRCREPAGFAAGEIRPPPSRDSPLGTRGGGPASLRRLPNPRPRQRTFLRDPEADPSGPARPAGFGPAAFPGWQRGVTPLSPAACPRGERAVRGRLWPGAPAWGARTGGGGGGGGQGGRQGQPRPHSPAKRLSSGSAGGAGICWFGRCVGFFFFNFFFSLPCFLPFFRFLLLLPSPLPMVLRG